MSDWNTGWPIWSGNRFGAAVDFVFENNKKCSYKLMPYLIMLLSYVGIILSKDGNSWINFAEFSIWRTEEMVRVRQSMIKRFQLFYRFHVQNPPLKRFLMLRDTPYNDTYIHMIRKTRKIYFVIYLSPIIFVVFTF